MAKLVITLAVISLVASWLQVCSSIPIDFEREDKSGISDLERNKNNATNPDISSADGNTDGSGSGSGFSDLEKNKIRPDIDDYDDEDYNDEKGSAILFVPYTELIRIFCERLKSLGIKYPSLCP